MNSNSAHPLARLMGAAIPFVALALIACPEKKEEMPPLAVVDAGAPAMVPAPTPAPEVDAGAAAAPEVDSGTAQAPAPGATPDKGAMTGTKTAAPTATTPGTGMEAGATTGTKTETPATGAAAGGATKAVTEPDKKTQRIWKAKCASCHGTDGKAGTEQGKKMKIEDMTSAAFQSHVTDAQMHKAIADGYKATVGGVAQEMPGYSGDLSPEQIDALVNYVRWIGKK